MELKKVDSKNVWEIIKLSVRDDQKNFVATNTVSIIDAYVTNIDGGVALPFGIYNDDVLVGFIMILYVNKDKKIKDDCSEIAINNYYIWRFMIDKVYQGRGFGRKALELAIKFIKGSPCGQAEYCWLSYESDNVAAKSLYNSMGFVENGMYLDNEVIAVLKL